MDVIASYMEGHPDFLVEPHLFSFEDFCYQDIPAVFKTPVQVDKKQVYLRRLRYEPPTLYPNEARLTNQTYSFNLYAGVDEVDEKGKEKDVGEVLVGTFPLMVNSSLCLLRDIPPAGRWAAGEHDAGGYFIVDGKEVVLGAEEAPAESVVHVRKVEGEWTASFGEVAVVLKAETETEAMGQIVVQLAGVTLPLFILMRALGITSDKAIIHQCLRGNKDLEDWFTASVHDAGKIFTQAAAVQYIQLFTRKKLGKVSASLLGHMVQKLLFVASGLHAPTDPASWIGKRVVLCGRMKGWLKEAYAGYQVGTPLKMKFEGTPLPRAPLAALACLRALKADFHPTQWGAVDPLDGQLALLARVTRGMAEEVVLEAMQELVGPVTAAGEKVVLNGVWVATAPSPANFMHVLRQRRRQGEWEDVNFAWAVQEGCIYIATDAGRLQWPLLYVDGAVSSDVEFLDALEANASYIAPSAAEVKKRHTHAELPGSILLGALSNLAAFPDHNPASARFSQLMQEAAAHAHVRARLDPETVLLHGGQTPLVKSAYLDRVAADPFGANVMVAVMSFGSAGTLTVNQGAVDRGLFHATRFTGFEAVGYEKDLPKEGEAVAAGEAVLRGVSTGGVVDKTYVSDGERGKQLAKVRVRKALPLKTGDTLASRAGLKGACVLLPERDMPFTAAGLRPDVIVNPGAFADSLAAGALLEMLVGKAHLVQGSFGDGTAFQSVGDYGAVLKKYGMHSMGNETLYDGVDGRVLEGDFFMGPSYYMRLAAPQPAPLKGVEAATRQPLGGVLVEEGERDAAVAHGIAHCLQDVYSGDSTEVKVDAVTGMLALHHKEMGVTLAPTLDGPVQFDGGMRLQGRRKYANEFETLRVPHAFKTLLQELTTMNVQMRLVTAPARLSETITIVSREQFRGMALDTPGVNDNELFTCATSSQGPTAYVYRSEQFPDAIFPYAVQRDDLLRLMVSSFAIKPAAGHASRHNKDKLDDPIYRRMDTWNSPRITLLYFFNKVQSGVLVRIKDNVLHNFSPVHNVEFANDFYRRLSLDGKTVDEDALLAAFPGQAPKHWRANNCVLRAGEPQDAGLAQMYDMIVETCGRRKVSDCLFILNREDVPYLGTNWTEAFPAVYGENAPMDKRWRLKNSSARAFIPVLSQCTSAAHADLPIPTYLDWDSITQKSFATVKGCKNKSPNVKPTPWDKRTGLVKWKDVALPIFYWRGPSTGCGNTVETNPRLNLTHLSEKYAPEPDNVPQNPLQAGILDARVSKVLERVKVSAAGKLAKVERVEGAEGASTMPLEVQAQKYRFALNVDGDAAAFRYGSLFKYGFCILAVKSNYQLWFERLTGADGKPLLVGGPVSADEVEAFCYLEVKADLSDLTETMQWCLDNDNKCRKVAENGVRFYEKYFTKEFVYDYLADAFNAISSKFETEEKTDEVNAFKVKAPRVAWVDYAPVPNSPLTKTVVILPYNGDAKTLNHWMRQPQYKGLNVLVVEQAEGFRPGALWNAGYDYVTRHAPEISEFVVQEASAVFPPDFVRDYYGLDGKAVVYLGKKSWRFTKDAYKKVNGFPNTFAAGADEALAFRLEGAEVYRPMLEEKTVAAASQEDLILDRLNWRMNGANSLQYRVVSHVLLNKSHNIRKIKVQFVPDVSERAIEVREPFQVVEKVQGEVQGEVQGKPGSEKEAGSGEQGEGASQGEEGAEEEESVVGDGAGDGPSDLPDEGGAPDLHLGVLELDGGVVNIVDGGGIQPQAMPVLENQLSLDQSKSSVKTVAFTS